MKRFALAAAAAALASSASAAPETYVVDPTHTYPSVEFPHMGISVWRGKFDRTSGTVVLDREAKTGTVDIAVDPSSINFGLKAMHEHAISPDWFDVAQFPKATYKGRIAFTGDKPSSVDGTLVFRGVSMPVKLAINSFACTQHPMTKKQVCGADAEGEVNWSQFGMKHSQYGQGDAGRTKLRIQVEASKAD